MASVILLTSEQAISVTGESSPGHFLEPMQISGADWILPIEVLSDPAHECHWATLSTLPVIEFTRPDGETQQE